MPKRRTQVLVRDPIGPVPKERKINTSAFLVTINPNEVFRDINSVEARTMIAKLEALGDFLLRKRSILAALTFKDRPVKEGEIAVQLSREQHLDKIIKISDERQAAVEIGEKYHKLHLHLAFEIDHRTYLHLSREFYLGVASRILRKDKARIHLNFRAATLHRGYNQYVSKNEPEGTKHFLDNAVAEYHSDT